MPNATRSRAVRLMMTVNKLHRGLLDLRAKELGMHRTQHRILMHLAEDAVLPSQKELAERLGITPAAVTVALRKIEQDGYIERTLGHDARYNELKITEKGRALVRRTRELFTAADTAMFDGLSDEELAAYTSCLEKMQKNMQAQTNVRKEQ